MVRRKGSATRAVDTFSDFHQGVDVGVREKEILLAVAKQTGFIPIKLLWRSDYFGSGKVGAFHYLGTFKKKKAVLKIQAARPRISEAVMIEKFSRQNRSKIIRPPHLFFHQPWQAKLGYEVLILEYVDGPKVVASGQLQSREKIQEFFNFYRAYKRNCLNHPWLPRTQQLPPPKQGVDQLVATAEKIKPNNPYRRPREDYQLALEAARLLEKVWQREKLVFQHGHFSVEDLIKARDGTVVLFSNLFWKWKWPFYDAVFGYHWFMYSLAEVKEITPQQIENQRQLWLEEIYSLADGEEEKRLILAALLERAISGLLLDSFCYIDEKNPVAEYLVTSTRHQVKHLMSQLG